MRLTTHLPLAMLVGVVLMASALADPPTKQVEFLSADTAEIWRTGERVAILTTGLDAERSYGVLLESDAAWIEVHKRSQPFPPAILQPYSEGRFLIEGKRGDSFFVSLRGGEFPEWLEVTIGEPPIFPPPPTDPPPEPSPDYVEVETLSRDLSQRLGDPPTAERIRVSLETAIATITGRCDSGQCPGIAEAKRIGMAAVDESLILRKGDSLRVDWLSGWRSPVDTAARKYTINTVAEYVALLQAIARGL